MQKTKKLLSIFLSFVMLMSISAGIDLSAYADMHADDFRYELLSNGTAEITGYDGKSNKIEIPSKIGKYTVTSIGAYAFSDSFSLSKVTLPDSITDIKEDAFSNCSSLTDINIPDSVTDIGKNAFLNCITLTSITLSGNMTSINEWTFAKCTSLENINIPDSITDIGKNAFYYCESLKNITIPNSVTNIGRSAFYYCKNLTSITIPDSVTDIGDSAFSGCSRLASVTIGTGIKTISPYTFSLCSKLRSITIPDSVTEIGDYAFIRCKSLLDLPFGNSVVTIGERAFSESDLYKITIPASVSNIGEMAFGECEYLASIDVDENNQNYSSEDGVLFNKDKTELVQYPMGIETKSYDIPESVTSIGAYAFYGCQSLLSITIPESVTSIGEYAFNGCSNLFSITIPDSVTNLGKEVFAGCYYLTVATIGNGIKTISPYTFSLCSSLTTITIPDSVTAIGNSAFYECKKLKNIDIPNNITSIGRYAFYGCSTLTNINIPNSVTNIEPYTFYGCTNLENISISNGVTNISESAFYGCTNLANVTIPNSVTNISKSAFYNCKSLKSLTIHDNVTSIGHQAFPDYAVIYGHKNSAAENYTRKNYSQFIELDTYKDTVTKATLTSNGKIVNKCTECGNTTKTTTIYYPKTVKLSSNYFTYNGKAQKPSVIVKDSQGKALTLNKDYTVTYSNAKSQNVGKYTVTINFKGNYSGSKTIGYHITAASPKTVKLSTNNFVYNGKVQKPSVVAKDSAGNTLVLNKDYTVTYSNANSKALGKYTVTIKFKGNYTGTKTIGYHINPKGTEFVPSNKGGFKAIKNGFTLKWNKQASQTTGYQIQYATKRDFSNAATVTIANPNTTSKTIKGRAGGTRYYVRIRTYKKANGKTYFSAWNSGTKSVVTLK